MGSGILVRQPERAVDGRSESEKEVEVEVKVDVEAQVERKGSQAEGAGEGEEAVSWSSIGGASSIDGVAKKEVEYV